MHAEIVVPLAGIALPAFLVPLILAFRQGSKKREFEHLERMRALEMGQPAPGESHWPQAFACAMIGAGVPIGAFLFTFLAAVNTSGMAGEVWLAPAVVSCFALMASVGLAKTLFHPTKGAKGEAQAKLQMDPDAYDVVGSRG